MSRIRAVLKDDNLVGLIAGHEDLSASVKSWAKSEASIYPLCVENVAIVESLYNAYMAIALLERVMSEKDIKTWFISLHPALHYEAPIKIIFSNERLFMKLIKTTCREIGREIKGNLCPRCNQEQLRLIEHYLKCLFCGYSESNQ